MSDVQTSAPNSGPISGPTPAQFRKAMGQFPTGVCVVALETDEGETVAMTINSFVSVSLEPLLVCWSLHNNSGRYDLFAGAKRFSISILAQDQAKQALAYAARTQSAVRDSDFVMSEAGIPMVKGALASFECRAYAAHLAGDHTMILGEVMRITGEAETGGKALGFFGGEFISVP